MEEGFALINMSKYKRWTAFLYRMIEKKTIKKRTDSSVCLHAAKKYEKVESLNTRNDDETASKK